MNSPIVSKTTVESFHNRTVLVD